jgi:hypothetical protein
MLDAYRVYPCIVTKNQIFDATGQVLSQMTLSEPGEEVSVTVQGYPPGLYYISLQTMDRVLIGKFFKN